MFVGRPLQSDVPSDISVRVFYLALCINL